MGLKFFITHAAQKDSCSVALAADVTTTGMQRAGMFMLD